MLSNNITLWRFEDSFLKGTWVQDRKMFKNEDDVTELNDDNDDNDGGDVFYEC